MSKFYVGQRVRVARIRTDTLFPEALGREAVIRGFWTGESVDGIWRDDWVEIDIDGSSNKGWVAEPWQLEPILDADDGITDEVRKELDRILSHEREGVAA